jgi:hypothetical protein
VVDFVLVNLVVLQFECLPLRSSVESPLRCLKTCNEEKAKNDTNEEEDQETQEDSQETTVGDSQQTVVEEENNDDGKSQTGGEERGQQHQPTNGLRLKNKRRRENAKKRKRGENASVEQRKEAQIMSVHTGTLIIPCQTPARGAAAPARGHSVQFNTLRRLW